MFLNTENYMMPCLNKQLFGVDCMGCGFQRAFVLLCKGNFKEAFEIYPAIFTLVFLLLLFLFQLKFKLNNSKKILIGLTIVNVIIITTSYFIKMKPIFYL